MSEMHNEINVIRQTLMNKSMKPWNIHKTSFNLNKELMYSKIICLNKKAPIKH